MKSFRFLFYLEVSSMVFAFVVDLDPFERSDLFCGNIQARNMPYSASLTQRTKNLLPLVRPSTDPWENSIHHARSVLFA